MSAGHAAQGARADPDRVREAVARRCGGEPVTVRETHISWVFLAADRAFKLKKPLVLDFLDYGTAERRRAMCRDEVRLNARLAPELYEGVTYGLVPALPAPPRVVASRSVGPFTGSSG